MPQIQKDRIVNPKWVKASMTMLQAANQAAMRGFSLQSSWDPALGLRIIAIPRPV